MANVCDPDAVGTVFSGHRQHVPNFGDWVSIDPNIAAWVPIVVEMKVNSSAPSPLALFSRRQPTNVPIVIIGPQQGDVIWDTKSRVVVAHDFFVKAP